jgi:hypothetical protein
MHAFVVAEACSVEQCRAAPYLLCCIQCSLRLCVVIILQVGGGQRGGSLGHETKKYNMYTHSLVVCCSDLPTSTVYAACQDCHNADSHDASSCCSGCGVDRCRYIDRTEAVLHRCKTVGYPTVQHMYAFGWEEDKDPALHSTPTACMPHLDQHGQLLADILELSTEVSVATAGGQQQHGRMQTHRHVRSPSPQCVEPPLLVGIMPRCNQTSQ